MFIPGMFKQDNIDDLLQLIEQYPFATLITHSETGIDATHLPMFVVKNANKYYLKAHIAKANPLWKSVKNGGVVLVTFHGPNCYISPNHYPTKKQTGKAVPTWNYVVVQVKGTISFIHDPDWIYNAIETLTNIHESGQSQPWSITDAPEPYIQKMIPAIVGIEITVTSIIGQWKLSQNQPQVNQSGVVEGLSQSTDSNIVNIASMISKNLHSRQ
jgi:transcriptional regulator